MTTMNLKYKSHSKHTKYIFLIKQFEQGKGLIVKLWQSVWDKYIFIMLEAIVKYESFT